MFKSSILKLFKTKYIKYIIKSIPETVFTVVRGPDDGCQHPKHVELPTGM